ncbi:aspartate/glutamate racemase family protein [Candidatus Gracilibacteria bacterium]|nr:aspartate/glutamate racemase family protein [Candidatus Gracilibacteria bacterium]
MIGIFDSGSGGLTFLAAMKRRFPEWSYLYYADYEHCPFGEKTPEEIQMYTIAGVQKLFDAGATIVILACNTASAWTLRKIQAETFPDKKVLGVTIPGAEKVIELGIKNVTVFATEQTVKSRTYAERVRILDSDTIVDEVALSGDLVRAIEDLLPVQRCHSESDFAQLFSLYTGDGWLCDGKEWTDLVQKYFGCIQLCHTDDRCSSLSDACISRDRPIILSTASDNTKHNPQGIILGCTHYSYIKKPLERLFPQSIFIDPSEESAEKLGVYIKKHSLQIAESGNIIFL